MAPADLRPRVDVELLERSLAYTRGALEAVADAEGRLPTPCAHWTVTGLLVHMVDSLEVVTELALGRMALAGPPPTSHRPSVLADHLRVLGCTLLERWMAPAARDVVVGSCSVDVALAAEVGALEVAVHGWDLATARGLDTPVPPLLAAALLPVAVRRVPVDARGSRFAPPVTPVASDPASLLLAHLGRRPGPG